MLPKEAETGRGGGTGLSCKSNCEEPPLGGKNAYPREVRL